MRSWIACAAALVVAAPTLAEAHIKLVDPAPRYLYSGTGQKTGPCGQGAPTGDVTWYQPGETITVSWEETINHPGYFRISLDPDGGDDGHVDPADYNDLYTNANVLLDDIQDAGGSTFSAQVTLPDIECESCSLQLIQVMTDKPPWGPAGGNDLYYWCADIRISTTPPMTTSATTGSGATGSATTGSSTTSGGVTAGGTSGAGGAGGADSDGDDEGGCAVARAGGGADDDESVAWLGLLGAGALAYARRRRS